MNREKDIVALLVTEAEQRLAAPTKPIVLVGQARVDALLDDLVDGSGAYERGGRVLLPARQ